MASWKTWIGSFRLRTLPLAFSSIIMGSLLAVGRGVFSLWIFALALLTTLFLQVLSNLANDYGDAVSGVDGAHRTGPSRAVSGGAITREEMKKALVICAGLALVSGITLLLLAFGIESWMFLFFVILGIGAIAAAIKYTVGSRPYGYSGWGDLFVLIFFGWVGVLGTFYLHAQTIDWLILGPATGCGLLAVGVLNVNNIRDIESDKLSGKNSIPVRLGRQTAIYYHIFLLVTALLTTLIYPINLNQGLDGYLFLLVIPLLVVNVRAVRTKIHAAELDPYLKQLALTTLLFVILFGVGQLQIAF